MSEFDIIECGFNVADETLNFGSRMLADGEDLFEAHTLATIKQSDAYEKLSNVNIQTCCKGNKLYYTINKTIGIFSNLTCTELSFNTVLEQKIDRFCVTPDSKFVFVCQRNGTVLYVNIEEQEIILTKDVVNNDCLEETFFVHCFIEEYTKTSTKFVIVAKTGSIYRLTFNIEANCTAILLLKEFGFKIRTSAIIFPRLLVNGEEMALYNLESGDSINGDPLDLIKVFPYSQEMFIGLDSNGSLVRICGRTLFYFYIKSKPTFKDFIYTTNESCTRPYCLCVTYEHDIQLYDSFPLLSEVKFSLKANNSVTLICPGDMNEDAMYISIIEKQNAIQELRLQAVIETTPEVRLKQLLRRQKFDEAENFAKAHSLSNTEVLKAKAQVIIDKRSCSNQDICNLLNILNSVDDIFFKLQSCIDTYQSCENLDDVQKILAYGCNCLVKHNVNREASELHEKVLDIMFRFDTFKLLQGLDECCFDWLEFHNCDLIHLLCKYLQKYEVDGAVIVYNRLDRCTKLKLDESRIDIILNLLDSLPLEVSRPFLYCFVPLSLSYIPSTLPLFVGWLKRKICSIEQEHFNEFPDNAIEFTDSTFRLMKSCSVNFQQIMVHQNAMDDLVNLIKALKTIQLLKNTYRIVVPLKEYLKDPKQLIQILLSLELDDDVFDKLLRNFLRKFILENDLEPDTIFLEVIQNSLEYEENYWLKVIPSILRNISSVEVKLNAVKAVIDVANKPWNRTLREMARSCLEYQHELAEVIKIEVENEPLYTILKKYFHDLQDALVDGSWDIWQVVGRIIYCNEQTMITDIYQFCKTSEEKHTANMMLIKSFLDKRDYKTALEILDNNSVEEIIDCSEGLIRSAKFFDEMELLLKSEPYIEIMPPLKSRLGNSDRPGNRTFVSLANNLQVCSQIRSSFYSKVKVSDLELPAKRQDLLTTLLYNLSQDLCDKCISPVEAVDSCKRIASLLNESTELTMIKFCEILSNNVKILIECANYIYRNENDAKRLCLMATLILKSIYPTANQDDTLDTTFYENKASHESTTNIKDGIKCLKIAHKLITKALLHAHLDELLDCVEVFNWTMASFYMIKDTCPIEKDLFPETYLPGLSQPISTSSLRCLKYIVNTYTSYCGINPELKYLTHFQVADNKITEAEFTNRIHQLPMMIQDLCLEGQSLTAFKVVLTLKHSLRHFKNIDNSVIQILNTIVKQCTTQLLHKVCSTNKIDTELAYNLLIPYGLNDSIAFVNRQLIIFKRQISKFKALAELALRILNNYKITTNIKFYVDIIQVSNWWIRIPECQIPIKTFFLFSAQQLLESLIHHHHVDLKMIQLFCKDFNLNVQCYYQIYLKKNLLNWEPVYDKVEDVYGNININIRTSESELLERCIEVVKLMEDKESVYHFVNNLRHEVNYYHYEVFSTIFTILEKLNENKDHERKLLLLHFLKTYRRINNPSDCEMEEWYTLFPDSQAIDPLSNWRMPFTPALFTIDIWKIIRPELNLQTYKIWFAVIPILDNFLNKNEICSYVIKKIVSSGILQKDTCDPCILYPIHGHLFELIDKCVQNMTNLEMATSAVYQLVMHTPKGADQVNAAKLCLKYAIQYKESGQENDPALLKAFIKVQKKYQSFAATHILQIYQINVEKYSNILLEPYKLIDALYMNESIIKRADRVLLNCSDINKAVDELGILFNIDTHETRLRLLESLLERAASLSVESDTNSANLKRAAYICKSEDTTEWRKYLLNVGLGKSDVNAHYKANALSCFINISDVLTIEELTEMLFDEFRKHIDKLYLLSDLEYLGLPMDIEILDKYKKTDLLKRLVRDVHNPITVKTMASICITYQEYDFKFWKIIINATISLNLIHLLRKYVHFLKNETAFKYKQFYVEAWQTIFNQSFEIDTTDSVYLYNSCVDNMLAIQSCPVLPSLNFTGVFNKCCSLQMYEFAAIIIQYFPIEEQKGYIEGLIKSKPNISSAVGKLSEFGICGTTKVQRMLESY